MAKFKHNPITNELDLVSEVDIAANVLDVISGSLVFNKNNSPSIDFRAKSLNSDSIIFIDSSADRVGISNVGLLPTDGLLHIQSGSAGAVTASTSANELVLESSSAVTMGLSLIGTNTSTQFIVFGDTDASAEAFFSFNHNNNTLAFKNKAGVGVPLKITETEVIINAIASATVDFRVEGDTITDLLFIDVSADNVHINNTTNAATALGHLHIGTGISPTAVLADGIVLGSKDSAVGSLLAVPELWIENPPEVIGTFTPSHKFKTWINGVEYFIQLDAA